MSWDGKLSRRPGRWTQGVCSPSRTGLLGDGDWQRPGVLWEAGPCRCSHCSGHDASIGQPRACARAAASVRAHCTAIAPLMSGRGSWNRWWLCGMRLQRSTPASPPRRCPSLPPSPRPTAAAMKFLLAASGNGPSLLEASLACRAAACSIIRGLRPAAVP